MGLLQSRIHKQMLSVNVYINLSVMSYVEGSSSNQGIQVQNIVDTSLLHHMQLELIFIAHCVFSPGTWVFQHDLITDM